MGVRVDDGFEQGMDIPIYYDPMIAKLIVHAKDRPSAIARMLRAIREYEVTGIASTLSFCEYVLQHEAFTSGKFDTKFVEKYFNPEVLNKKTEDDMTIVAAIAAMLIHKKGNGRQINPSQPKPSPTGKWKKRRWN